MIKDAIKFVFLIILFLPGMLQQVRAEKTDIVILYNGDKITGEVKRMEFAILTFKTDAMKTLSIEWGKIAYLRAQETFRIELQDGFDFSGSIDTDTLTHSLIIKFDSLSYKANLDAIIRIIPIKDTFLKRLKASVDLGFSYTKASDVAQLTANASSSYRSWLFLHELSFNSIVTVKKDSAASQNVDLGWSTSRFFLYRWFLNGFIGMQKNTELGLDLRILIGAGGGKDIFRTNINLFAAASGLQITQEWTQDSEASQTNLEGLAVFRFSKFQYNDPEIDLTATLKIYPSITTPGRIRLNFNTDLKWEIYNDLFWKLTFYDNFDNKPPSAEGSTNDFGITLSLGWSY